MRRIVSQENRPVLIALIVACAFFMEILDGTVIATAIPQMARSFHENPVNLSIGMSAYLFTLAVFVPASGWIADRFGSKTTFATAIVIFTLASLLCGSANALLPFVAARVVQGIGGAMMVPVGRLVVLRSSDKRDLIRLTQFVTTPGLVAMVLGPPIGGFITTYSSWRWIFFLNVPLGILGLALVLRFFVNHRAEERRPFDVPGFVLSGVGLAALVVGLDQVARPYAPVWAIASLLGTGVVFCAAALVHLRRAAHPILDLSLFRIPTFARSALFGGTAFRIVIGTTPFLWPLLFQIGFGLSAFASSLLIIACAIGDVSMKVYASRILRRFGFRRTLFVNGLLAAGAISLCATFTVHTPVAVIFLVLLLIGCLRSVQFGSFNALMYVDVPRERMSAATSLGSTIQQLSWGLGITFAASILGLGALVHHPGIAAYGVDDFRLAFAAVAVLAVVSAFDFLRLDPGAGAERRVIRSDRCARPRWERADARRLRAAPHRDGRRGSRRSDRRTGPPLVCLHGYPQSHLTWRAVAPLLAERFTVVLPDLRGYGESEIVPSDDTHAAYSKRTMARDVVALMQALGFERFLLAGHDRGARVAYRLALDAPERVAAIAVLDIIPTIENWEAMDYRRAFDAYHWSFLAQAAPLPERLIGADPAWYCEQTLRHWLEDQGAIEADVMAAYRAAFAREGAVHAACEDYRAGYTVDLDADRADRDAGRRIAQPLLALWGGGTNGKRGAHFGAVWERWADQLTTASLPCGHFLMEERPVETASILTDFFARVAPHD